MKNIRITFRLSPYHIARALEIVRRLEPTYQLISINDLMKTISLDYISKMTQNRFDTVPQELIDEVTNLNLTPTKKLTLESLSATITNKQKHQSPTINETQTKSTISTASDFSPPQSLKEFIKSQEKLKQDSQLGAEGDPDLVQDDNKTNN